MESVIFFYALKTGFSGNLFTDTDSQSHKMSKIKAGLPGDATYQTAKPIGFRQEYSCMFLLCKSMLNK